ncbi:MAG TPA: arginine deiminase-related protein [Chitinophagales bacterium]|nr:arginine deiminase-related protein [Chitinophagales bacterium]
MLQNKTYSPSEIDFTLSDIPFRPEPRKVLIATPEYFDVVDVKNVHMEGKVGGVDKNLAVAQWNALRSVYLSWKQREILEDVLEIKGAGNLEDMVFTANQSFPWLLAGKKVAVLSKMRHASRQREVPYFREFYKKLGYQILELKGSHYFEGMGDLIPHYGKNLLYGGYGHRTEAEAYIEISQLLKVPVVLLKLEDPRFYHLDTCFLPADENTVLLTPAAFQKDDLQGLKKLFTSIIEIPDEEADRFFALNAHLVNDQKTKQKAAVLQKGTTVMKRELNNLGFEVTEIDTSEFIKSGGSCFCMKMMVY